MGSGCEQFSVRSIRWFKLASLRSIFGFGRCGNPVKLLCGSFSDPVYRVLSGLRVLAWNGLCNLMMLRLPRLSSYRAIFTWVP